MSGRDKGPRWDIYNAVVWVLRHYKRAESSKGSGTCKQPVKRDRILKMIKEKAGTPVWSVDVPRVPVMPIPAHLKDLGDRTMRRAIHACISAGAWPTVMSKSNNKKDEGGYYLAQDAAEIRKECGFIEKYLVAHAARLAGLKKAADTAEAQAAAQGKPGQAAMFDRPAK